jgi:phosphate transport system substrate-binding protein
MQKSTSARRNSAALKFFAWSLDSGADAAAELGYVPLPPDLVKQVKQYWTANLNSAF